ANRPVTLVPGGEPTSDDGDPDTNLTVDFGFTPAPATTPPEYDYGDAPDVVAGNAADDYRTTALDAGAVHPLGVAGAPFLGDCVDADDGFAQGVGAVADDLASFGSVFGTCITPGDDEDGVSIPNPVSPGASITIGVSASAGTNDCVLDAWIDWDGDGVFEAGEQIATSLTIPSGTSTNLSPTVPSATSPGFVYGRFRCSSAGGLGPEGFALDGEVEDHVLAVVGTDYGDAPDSYATLDASNGARHTVDPGNPFYLGGCVDTDLDGQPAPGADGDDGGIGTSLVGTCLDDEDGVVFATPPQVCRASTVTVTVNQPGLLDAWIDFGNDGSFDPIDRVFTGQVLSLGANDLLVNVPCNALPGPVVGRFRLSSAGVATPDGPAADGEVEDHVIQIGPAEDFGDAPDSYGTLLASNGPRHAVTGASLYLGACVDAEGDAGSPLDATGDDVTIGPATTVGTCAGNDDEDGVTFDSLVIACQNAQLTVTAGSAGLLDAWIDFGLDGSFDPGDQIFDDLAIAAGPNALAPAVPCSAVPGPTFARFRLSTAGVAGATGAAADGEVEDHPLTISARDWGDAPDSYGTLATSGGPFHEVSPSAPLYLGTCVDTEADASLPLDSTGDDGAVGLATVLGTCTGGDDEDGIGLPPFLVACDTTSLTTTASLSGQLDGWIDFGLDGIFDAADQILTDNMIPAGVDTEVFSVPCDLVAGTTYARFRLSSAGGLAATGGAADGEVEDYAIELRAVDLGDAPDSYGTLVASDGARHGIVAGFHLGAGVDSEPEGQPSSGADGDDLGAPGDDEDGIAFPPGPLVACSTVDLEVTHASLGPNPVLDAWIDWDADGSFDTPRDRVPAVVLTSSPQIVPVAVPCDLPAPVERTYARFRLTESGSSGPTGSEDQGEVEDYAVELRPLDFGDAPDPTYPTLLASDGARHAIAPIANPTLGATVDAEADGQPSAKHNGDDLAGVDDEDGVTFPAVLIPGTDGQVEITTGAFGGLVSAWIDFDGNGDWSGPGEQILTDAVLGAADTQVFTFPVPVGSPEGTACVRVRISSAGGLGVTGLAPDGEVEDHLAPVGVEDPAIGVTKRLVDLVEETPLVYLVTFEMGLYNFGNVPLSEVDLTVDLATGFAEAAGFEVVSLTSPSLTVNPAFDGVGDLSLLDSGNTLAVGDFGLVTLEIRLDSGGFRGPYVCSATGMGISPEDMPVDDDSQDGGDPDPDGDGDAEDDDVPTVFELPVSILEIPTAGTAGLLTLALLLAALALVRLRGRL
ncbi:MAG: GEVED domain-containing protein, partial [Holophagales bacterium]|nr:GEVED domain-containing protein [Holophagales bacterium]